MIELTKLDERLEKKLPVEIQTIRAFYFQQKKVGENEERRNKIISE